MAQTQPQVFDVNVYEGVYPDIANAYGANTTGATNHWTNFGLPSGRRASIIFDPAYYLQHNSDLLAAFGANGYAAALNHFVNQGLPNEGRRGSLEFDVRYYLGHYSDLAAAFGTNYLAAANHFLNQGLPVEGRQGSPDFFVQNYLSLYPDVSAGYGATNYQEATLHWLRRGIGLGRSGTGTPQVSNDCKAPTMPNRIYFADPAHFTGTFGDGSTESSPLTGGQSTHLDHTIIPNNLDYQLRCRVEGTQDCTNDNIVPTANLIVCLEAGDYKTDGLYDILEDQGHTAGTNRGFSLGQGWKIHGYGMNATFVHLNSFFPIGPGDPRGLPANTGYNIMFGTHDDFAFGEEVSDLTIDLNYAALKGSSSTPLNLLAVNLRSFQGGHKIHHVNVLQPAGEIASQLGEQFEAFPVRISSVNASPDLSGNNLIQWVLMSGFAPGRYTAINVDNVAAEVSYNVVNGGENAYGGFNMPLVWFHDNTGLNNGGNGFITDSLVNRNVLIQFNRFVNTGFHGIIIGGGGTYDNFQIQYNTFALATSSSANNQLPAGIMFQGNVVGASVINNTISLNSNTASPPPLGIRFSGGGNVANQFQFNQVTRSLGNNSVPVGNCAFNNWDEFSVPLSTFPNTQSSPCVSPTAQLPLISSQLDALTNRVDVYYLGGDSGVHQLSRDTANQWHAFDLSFETKAPHVAGGLTTFYDSIHGTPQIEIVGSLSKIYSEYFTAANGWQILDVTAQTNSTAGANPGQLIGLIDPLTNRPEMYYVGLDLQVHELSGTSLSTWQHFFFMPFGAPSVNPQSGLTAVVDRTLTNSLQLFYVDNNLDVNQIANGAGGLNTFDVTAYTGATPAMPGPGLASVLNPFGGGALEIYYLGTDQHINQIAWTPQFGWFTFDLSSATGAPPASSTAGITALVDTLNGYVQVFYSGTDHHIHQIGLSPSGWFTFDVSANTGATGASSGTGMTSLINAPNGSLEIYYGGTDSHVHELIWKASTGWRTFDVNTSVVP